MQGRILGGALLWGVVDHLVLLLIPVNTPRASPASNPSLACMHQECEAFLVAASGKPSFPHFKASLEPARGGGPCTAVWTAGTIAYRCKTCGLTASSAVCMSCFQV